MMSDYWWIGSIILVCGWFVLQHFNDGRETRKELRSQIGAVISLIEEVQRHCYEYYASPGGDPRIAKCGQDIRCKVKQIGTRVSNLNNQLPQFALTSRSVKFRKAATLKLDDCKRPALPSSDPIYEEISYAGGALISSLEGAFRSRFGS